MYRLVSTEEIGGILPYLKLPISTETCLSDVKKMEPIDGVNKISKVCGHFSFCVSFTPSLWAFQKSYSSSFFAEFLKLGSLETNVHHLCGILWSLYPSKISFCDNRS